jgi:peptide-methionine (S)-S-oxide reductase
MGLFQSSKLRLPEPGQALPGRDRPIAISNKHFVNGTPLKPPFPAGMEQVQVGLGCFWGAERRFWQQSGVYTTAVGYSGGQTPNPTYEEVCSGRTGHAETVLVVFDPAIIRFADVLRVFWESHDPTQGMRQGNDAGTQYRSALYTYSPEHRALAEDSARSFQVRLTAAGFGAITTEIRDAPEFYYAEEYHQQYLAKNPNGYCGLGGTGVSCPLPVLTATVPG